MRRIKCLAHQIQISAVYPYENSISHPPYQPVKNMKNKQPHVWSKVTSLLFLSDVFMLCFICVFGNIVSTGKHISNTNLSDLSIVDTRDIFNNR